MQKVKDYFSIKKDIRLYAALTSALFSVIVLSYHQPTNSDALYYINSAKAYGTSGLKAAMAIYPWPFFSVILYYTAKITHLSLLYSGLLINNIFMAMLAVTFISLVKTLGGHYRTQCIAAIIVLMSHYLNHFRDNVLRDVGYYAFGLLAVLFMVRYCRHYRWRHAFAFSLSVLLATLFRVEGVAFIVLGPLVVLCQPRLRLTARFMLTLRAYALPIMLTLIMLIALYATGKLSTLTESRIPEIIFQLKNAGSAITSYLNTAADHVREHVVSYYGRGDALTFVLWGVMGIFFSTLISCLGWVYTILFCHSVLGAHFKTHWQGKSVIYWFSIINVFVCLSFISQRLFLSQRYIVFLTLLMMLPATYSCAAIYKYYRTQKSISMRRQWVFTILCLGLFYNLVAGLGHFGISKSYLVEAGQWIAERSTKDDTVYTNNGQLFIYTKRTGKIEYNAALFLKGLSRHVKKGVYIAIKIDHNEQKDYKEILKKPAIKTFQNKRGDKVMIFKGEKK